MEAVVRGIGTRREMWRVLLLLILLAIPPSSACADIHDGALLHLDFADESTLSSVKLKYHRLERTPKKPLEFTDALQSVEIPGEALAKLDGAKAATVGGWFWLRRASEQTIFCREVPTVAPLGERMFR